MMKIKIKITWPIPEQNSRRGYCETEKVKDQLGALSDTLFPFAILERDKDTDYAAHETREKAISWEGDIKDFIEVLKIRASYSDRAAKDAPYINEVRKYLGLPPIDYMAIMEKRRCEMFQAEGEVVR